jgi:hypothetical protein
MFVMMRNPNAVHIDFKDLNGLMGKIVPSNIDMVMERNGYFLVGEWKREGELISMGQNILLKQLARLEDRFTVLVIQGHTDEGTMVVDKFWHMDTDGVLVPVGEGVDTFKQFLVYWKESVEAL